jgi:hypothetical protein
MSNNKGKKMIGAKDLLRTAGNKTPEQFITGLVVKKNGKYKLVGSKADKKIAVEMCRHHIIDKKGNLKPIIEYSDNGKIGRCPICKRTFPTKFMNDIQERTDEMSEGISQAKMISCAIGADRETTNFLTTLSYQTTQFPKVYKNMRNIAEKADRKKKKKKNKKNQKSLGTWYSA